MPPTEIYKGWLITYMGGFYLATRLETTRIRRDTIEEVKAEIDQQEEPLISCPFCGQKDFDLIGLKGHFIKGYCDIYNETEGI
jgi:hypothetical protein